MSAKLPVELVELASMRLRSALLRSTKESLREREKDIEKKRRSRMRSDERESILIVVVVVCEERENLSRREKREGKRTK